MKILLVGASSYVGARLYYDLCKKYKVIGTYYGNKLLEQFVPLNVTDKKAIQTIIYKYEPDIIIHAASGVRSQWCEDNPALAVKINQESTIYIVDSANNVGAKVILISTFAAINPNNVYGKTKQESEKYVKQTKNGFIILRPSLIIGFSPNTKNDRPFNRILKNIDFNTEAMYDTSWKFQPTYLGHISEVISQIIDRNIINEIIPITVPEIKSRYDIAYDILKAFAIKAQPLNSHDTTPVTTDSLEKLKILNLQQYSYQEIVSKIIEEINTREITFEEK